MSSGAADMPNKPVPEILDSPLSLAIGDKDVEHGPFDSVRCRRRQQDKATDELAGLDLLFSSSVSRRGSSNRQLSINTRREIGRLTMADLSPSTDPLKSRLRP